MRRATFTTTLSACLLMWLVCGTVLNAQAPGGVYGSVTDAAGKPLADVTLTLTGPSTFSTRSGADGQFVLEGVPDGEYVLTAALEGFAIARRTVLVVRGTARLTAITLEVRALAEVTVTADRTGERPLSEVPLAVSVLSEADLERNRSRTIADLGGHAPSMTFAQNTGFAQITIRGIGTNAVFAGSDSSSVVYLDGVYLARPAAVLGDFLDIERIEILRGPQGTLYGRNAVGGAINVVTRLPTNEPEL